MMFYAVYSMYFDLRCIKILLENTNTVGAIKIKSKNQKSLRKESKFYFAG